MCTHKTLDFLRKLAFILNRKSCKNFILVFVVKRENKVKSLLGFEPRTADSKSVMIPISP